MGCATRLKLNFYKFGSFFIFGSFFVLLFCAVLHVLLLLRCGVSGAASGLYIYFAHFPSKRVSKKSVQLIVLADVQLTARREYMC